MRGKVPSYNNIDRNKKEIHSNRGIEKTEIKAQRNTERDTEVQRKYEAER